MVAQLDLGTTAWIMVVFFLAGVIKGVVGFGMPLFALSVLSISMPLSVAIAANVGPSLVTNFMQAVRGPYLRRLVRRLWPFLVPALALIWLGTRIQTLIDPAIPGLLLGVLAMAFAATGLSGFALRLSAEAERWLGPVVGSVNGFVTGITGVFVIPGGLYLQSLGLRRDELVQALGILFLLSTAMIGVVFTAKSLMTPTLALVSALAIGPGIVGMRIGERLRQRLSERLFRIVFLLGLGVIGFSLTVRNGAALLG